MSPSKHRLPTPDSTAVNFFTSKLHVEQRSIPRLDPLRFKHRVNRIESKYLGSVHVFVCASQLTLDPTMG
ncbi:unnamed protein product [Echinostoma caproni]|uniref:Uncharacterized protein n=1 Tax=Echinostoma caproni TaxID=27848 RepID=A0A183AD33_9TREM|nr:unnamed protein product [Echinostoma caproni]